MSREDFWIQAYMAAAQGINANSNPDVLTRAEDLASYCSSFADYSLKYAQRLGVVEAQRRWWQWGKK